MRNQTFYEDIFVWYLQDGPFKNKNFLISTQILKMGICALIVGSDGETKEKLLKSIGYKTEEPVKEWYQNVKESLKSFQTSVDTMNRDNLNTQMLMYGYITGKKPTDFTIEEKLDMAHETEMNWIYQILNSIWINLDKYPDFSEEYKKQLKEQYGGDAFISNSAEINKAIDAWLSRMTNGYVSELTIDFSNYSSLLLNMLNFRCAWEKSFQPDLQHRKFTNILNCVSMKNFITNSGMYDYYKDDYSVLVVVPLEYNMKAVFVLGEFSDIKERIERVSPVRMNLSLPKFDIMNVYKNEILYEKFKNYMNPAEFTKLIAQTDFQIEDIIQVNKLNMTEYGFGDCSYMKTKSKKEEKVFTERPLDIVFDRPFHFYILDGNNDDEILFCGQIYE